MATTVVSWNIAKRHEAWRQLVDMGADVALLQEAGMPPADVADRVDTGPREHWDSHVWNSQWWEGRGWRGLFDRSAMVVRLSDRVEVEWFKQVGPISEVAPDEIAVSGLGTIAAARVTPRDGAEPFIAVSVHANMGQAASSSHLPGRHPTRRIRGGLRCPTSRPTSGWKPINRPSGKARTVQVGQSLWLPS